MKIAVFSTKPHDRETLGPVLADHEVAFLEPRLAQPTVGLADGFEAVCLFVNDEASASVLEALATAGVRSIALRSTGYNNVDLEAAARLGIAVARVPDYSPFAVAEHAVALMLALDRKIHRAYARVREGNFSLDGLMGFDLRLRTVGIVGTGKIGRALAGILRGFGCRLLAHDLVEHPDCVAMGVEYVDMPELLARSDVISLHCPLTPSTHHIIDEAALAQVRPGVMLINTSRGGLVDTPAVIERLKDGTIGHLGLDVYEEEAGLFFEDLSSRVITDDVFSRLLTFPNVIVTGHQAFFTRDALDQIAAATAENFAAFAAGRRSPHAVSLD